MPRLAKVGALGDGMRKAVQDIDNATLSTIEHTFLYYAVETMMANNSTHLRKLGIFMGVSVAYNMILQRVQSSESSGGGMMAKNMSSN